MNESKKLLKIFSTNVRNICKQKSIQIGKLEEQIGVSHGYLSRLDKSEKAICLANLYKTSKILETSLDDLLDEELSINRKIQELKEEIATLEDLKGKHTAYWTFDKGTFACSACGYVSDIETDVCPSCGSRMVDHE